MSRPARLLATAAFLPVAWAAPAVALPPVAVACDYSFVAWSGGFVADLTITNHGPAVIGWTARWTMPTATGNLGAWQATMSQPDPFTVTATNLPYNAVIDTGRSVRFGWTASAASTGAPVDITVNGVPC
ncbi:cellulose binding domain-containing protein [Dactylosporangium cerinum]|uniref:Cellulose binding domain-containing protein n=1 Tax=Dactylosporangium cerinum TaxID=1434730 RepID=A0ABV9W3V8_9ACTN